MAVHLVHCLVIQMGALLGDADGPPVGSPLGPLLGSLLDDADGALLDDGCALGELRTW